jgi:tRNA threonylcarbamoyladenosine biosynthesis protein TsaE
MKKTITTNSFEETQKLGEEFAQNLQGGEVLALYGDLGSGKTTFMQGLAKGLGVTRNINSPTFIIMRTYDINRHSGLSRIYSETDSGAPQNDGSEIKNLYHVDLYRIENEKDVEGLGLVELLNDPQNIVAIEWPDKVKNILPEKRISIYFKYVDEDKRTIDFT